MGGLLHIRGALIAAALLAVAVLLPWAIGADAAFAAENPDGVTVIIGNKTYKGHTPAVDFAHNDAEGMKRFVIDVLGFREGKIIDLRDASQAELLATFGTNETHEGNRVTWDISV